MFAARVGGVLEGRSQKEVEGFLAELRSGGRVLGWQVEQARHALRILYEGFLPSLRGRGRPAAWKDRPVRGEVARRYPGELAALRNAVRVRHYS